jgi:hypothetical protein
MRLVLIEVPSLTGIGTAPWNTPNASVSGGSLLYLYPPTWVPLRVRVLPDLVDHVRESWDAGVREYRRVRDLFSA